MTALLIDLFGGILLGAIGRLMYGNRLVVPSQVSYLILLPLGLMLGIQNPTSAGWAAGALVMVAAAAAFNPGHGSYFDLGASLKLDNEIVRFIVKFIADLLRQADTANPYYDAIGCSVRYGLATAFIALVMWGCNTWLGTTYALWYAALGLVVGPFMLALRRPVPNAEIRWRIGEAFIGALIYGGLSLAA